MCYRQYPVDGQFEGLPDRQEVDEDPEESSDETDDGDEQKPVRASQNGGRGAGHAHDAKHLATDRQTINKMHCTFRSRRSRTSMSGISTARDDSFSATISTFRDCFQRMGIRPRGWQLSSYRTDHCQLSPALPLIKTHFPRNDAVLQLHFITNKLSRYARFAVTLTFSRLMTYICRTAPLTSRCCILYIYSPNIRTEYFKHAAHSPFFPLQNAVYFIMLPFLVPVLFTF